jgi:hypothetical protein
LRGIRILEKPLKTPWAIILCKFSDGDSEPFPMQYYKDLFTPADVGSKWNMVKFFNECAHGAIDVSGSQVFGWFKLNKTVADYNSLGVNARAALIGGPAPRPSLTVTICRRSTAPSPARTCGATSAPPGLARLARSKPRRHWVW